MQILIKHSSTIDIHKMAIKTYAEVAKSGISSECKNLSQYVGMPNIDARHGILKVKKMQCEGSDLPEIQEDSFWFNSAACPYTGELPSRRFRDLSNRREALKRYEEMDAVDKIGSTCKKGASSSAVVMFKEQRAIEFAIQDSPATITVSRTQEESSSVCSEDTLAPFAARVLDQVQAGILSQSIDSETALRAASVYIQQSLVNHEKVVGPCNEGQMVASALAQADDLVERAEARIQHLDARRTAAGGAPQHDVRELLRWRASAPTWSADDEADYVDTALARVPDALTQRHLLSRVGSNLVGIDADVRNLAALRAAAAALRGLLPSPADSDCEGPQMCPAAAGSDASLSPALSPPALSAVVRCGSSGERQHTSTPALGAGDSLARCANTVMLPRACSRDGLMAAARARPSCTSPEVAG